MAKKKPKGRLKLPGYLEKRGLLYAQSASKERLKSLGDLYLEEGYLDDALDFYLKADDRVSLERLKTRAIETGDASILVRLQNSSKIDVTKEDWQRAGEKAEEFGKETCAQVCFARIGGNSLEENEGKGGGKQ